MNNGRRPQLTSVCAISHSRMWLVERLQVGHVRWIVEFESREAVLYDAARGHWPEYALQPVPARAEKVFWLRPGAEPRRPYTPYTPESGLNGTPADSCTSHRLFLTKPFGSWPSRSLS
ncbi:hypothetical protein QQZ08_005967 [Neonectria magnoliae]|uniref:Uncharacterized protein n=1 Tax=Neonectria magnoliae TaxID=2732573 RepID=A0ABR1I1Y8_9HYPO